MSEDEIRYPKLDVLYRQYLTDENSATFIKAVSQSYSTGTIERLARFGGRATRRASVLALGFIGNFSQNEVMGTSLIDHDRAVRMLADHGIRQLWQRQGTPSQQIAVQKLYRLINQSRMSEAIDLASSLILENPTLGEAWNQRAIAYCSEGEYEYAIEDCRESLNCNRFHFPAAMGLAHCCLQLEDVFSALESFRLALRINPDLEGVRGHVSHLERILEEG